MTARLHCDQACPKRYISGKTIFFWTSLNNRKPPLTPIGTWICLQTTTKCSPNLSKLSRQCLDHSNKRLARHFQILKEAQTLSLLEIFIKRPRACKSKTVSERARERPGLQESQKNSGGGSKFQQKLNKKGINGFKLSPFLDEHGAPSEKQK